MSARTITSPGVQINEVDLSIMSRPNGATNVFITGFASHGPTDEVINNHGETFVRTSTHTICFVFYNLR